MPNQIIIYCLTGFMLLTFSVQAQKQVTVNGDTLSQEIIRLLENAYQVKIQPGAYWYDQNSGFWGLQGSPPAGIMLPGLNLGGPLKADASNGQTNIFINGRQITRIEQQELIRITGTPIQPGRYWLNAQGWAGLEGQGALVNLYHLASQFYRQGSGSSFYRNQYTGTGMGSSQDGFYIMGEDFSYSQF